MTVLPSLFVSHGAPTLAIKPSPAHDFLKGLAGQLPRPDAILVATAHWETDNPAVSAAPQPPMIYDFFGFPKPLYEVVYAPPGDPARAQAIKSRLQAAGFVATIDDARGLDHGTWTPLCLAYAAADIPVLQLSVQRQRNMAHHIAVGRALAPLRAEGVLVIGSGGVTHNLSEWRKYRDQDRNPAFVTDFADWLNETLAEGREEDLVRYRERAPEAVRNHPTDEHFLPLGVAYGAAGAQPKATRLHHGVEQSILAMDAYRFD